MTWTQLHKACEEEDTNAIIELLRNPEYEDEKQVAIDIDDHASTPLHVLFWAATLRRPLSTYDANKHSPTAVGLLRLNYKSPYIENTSSSCSDKNSKDSFYQALQALLKVFPTAVTMKDKHGDTPLHIACRNPLTDKHIVNALLDVDASVISMVNDEGLLPIHVACRHAPTNECVIGQLIEKFPEALHARAKIENCSYATEGDGIDFNRHYDSMVLEKLFCAATYQQVRDGGYPLHYVVKTSRPSLPVVGMLIKAAPDVLLKTNKYGETPLHIALKHYLSQTNISCSDDRQNNTSLMENDDVIETLIRFAPDALGIKEKTHGNLPIHTAAISGCSDHVIKILLATLPQSIHETNAMGLTPIDLALQHGNCSQSVLRIFEISDHSV